MVRRRPVYHLAGYDPIDAGAQYRRFARQLDVFRRTWNVDATLSAFEQSNAQSRAWWTVNSRGANWQVEALHEALLWDDIVRGDFTRPLPLRLFKAARAYLDFIVTGTMFRYIFANQRYAGFFLFPILSVILFAAGGWLVARLLTAFLGLQAMSAAPVGAGACSSCWTIGSAPTTIFTVAVRISMRASIVLRRRCSRVRARAR